MVTSRGRARRARRAGRSPRRARPAGHGARLAARPERVGDALDVGPDVVQAGGMQVDDLHRLPRGRRRRATSLNETAQTSQRSWVTITSGGPPPAAPARSRNRQRVAEDGAHVAIDLPAAPTGRSRPASGRAVTNALGGVALVGDPDQVGSPRRRRRSPSPRGATRPHGDSSPGAGEAIGPRGDGPGTVSATAAHGPCGAGGEMVETDEPHQRHGVQASDPRRARGATRRSAGWRVPRNASMPSMAAGSRALRVMVSEASAYAASNPVSSWR